MPFTDLHKYMMDITKNKIDSLEKVKYINTQRGNGRMIAPDLETKDFYIECETFVDGIRRIIKKIENYEKHGNGRKIIFILPEFESIIKELGHYVNFIPIENIKEKRRGNTPKKQAHRFHPGQEPGQYHP